VRIEHSPELAARLETGSSLAVSGTCLTVIEQSLADGLAATLLEMSPETLNRTTLGELEVGDEVNLESALRMGDALGGHWVQGHVDGTTTVVARRDVAIDQETGRAEHREIRFETPVALAANFVEKGSVTVDGVSLTVSACQSPGMGEDGDTLAGFFEVALIPHTLQETTLDRLEPGTRVNLEVDILSKYVERALAARGLSQS
jgi:riboflavin synthase